MATTPNLLSVAKIWDQGVHNAFTDLLRFDDRWWCTFREAEDHGPSIGTVRVITSEDGADWQSVALLEEQEVDLRDPKLSVAPDGRLMLVMGGCVYGSGEHGTRSPRIAFSSDGINWTAPQKVLAEDHWAWPIAYRSWARALIRAALFSTPVPTASIGGGSASSFCRMIPGRPARRRCISCRTRRW